MLSSMVSPMLSYLLPSPVYGRKGTVRVISPVIGCILRHAADGCDGDGPARLL